MKILFIILLFFFASCAIDIANVTFLSKEDQAIFAIAADTRGVELTENEAPWIWMVQYGNVTPGYNATATCKNEISCVIRLLRYPVFCPGADIRQAKLNTYTHEIRHIQGEWGHSPSGVMAESPICESNRVLK